MMVPTLHDVISRVPLWANATGLRVAPLPGGFTNINYRVEVGHETFVLRLNSVNAAALGINRVQEYQAACAAAALAIAPDVLYVVEPEGHWVTPFIPGRRWTRDDMRNASTMRRILETLQHVHGLSLPAITYAPFRTIARYVAIAQRHAVPFPAYFATLMRHLDAIETAERADPSPVGFCHNDLVRSNLLDDGSVRILDWEYAGMGNVYFDLASLAIDNRLSGEQERWLLEGYFGRTTPEHMNRLRRMEQVFLVREATWALAQLALSDIAYDFRHYADSRFAWALEHVGLA